MIPTRAGGGPRWQVAEYFGVRIAGLPAGSIGELRFDKCLAHLEAIRAAQATLRAEADAIADALHTAIGELSEIPVKPRVIGLRRSIHRLCRPARTEWDAGVAAALPAALAARTRSWLASLDELAGLRAALPELIEAEAADKELVLRDLAADPLFRRALSQAGASLAAELEKWLTGAHRPKRRTLLGLTNFVTRAVTKTSPYSTFTLSGIGTWTDGDTCSLDPGPPAGLFELHGHIVRATLTTLAARPELAGSLRVRVNPSATASGDRVCFLGAAAPEPIVTVPLTPAIRACLRIVRERRPSLAELHDILAANGDPERVSRFLAKLTDTGLLETVPPVPDQSADPLGDLAAWVRSAGPDLAGPLAALERVGAELRRPVAITDVAGHRTRQRNLHDAIDNLSTALRITRDTDGPRKAAFHENAVHPGPVVELSRDSWRPALDDLDLFRRWLGVLGPTLPLRIALGDLVRRRFGSGARLSFLDFHRAVQAKDGEVGTYLDVATLPLTSPVLAASALPRVRQLHALRTAALAELRAGTTPDALEHTVAGWPDWITPPESLSCYLQRTPGGERAVLNLAMPGHGRGRNRLFRLVREAGGIAVPTGPPHARPEVLAELGGTFASTVNRRHPGAPYEIDYPFTVSDRPADQRIPLHDLVVTHDPDTDLLSLRSVRLGRAVKPAHLGMMAEFLLPPAARLLMLAFGDTFLVHPSVPLLASFADISGSTGITRLPRVEIGSLVVQRARWIVPPGELPVRRPGEGDGNLWARLLTWLRDNGIPLRTFVRAWPVGEESDRFRRWALGKARKPVYLDVANWFQVQAFEHRTGGGAHLVIFEEALPDPAEAGPRVTEYLLEISEAP
jgi:hypothetical protein